MAGGANIPPDEADFAGSRHGPNKLYKQAQDEHDGYSPNLPPASATTVRATPLSIDFILHFDQAPCA